MSNNFGTEVVILASIDGPPPSAAYIFSLSLYSKHYLVTLTNQCTFYRYSGSSNVNIIDSDLAINMSHAQIWDDSALIDTWNEALEEYRVWLTHHLHKLDMSCSLTRCSEISQHSCQRRAHTPRSSIQRR